jgi:hypothetical protein
MGFEQSSRRGGSNRRPRHRGSIVTIDQRRGTHADDEPSAHFFAVATGCGDAWPLLPLSGDDGVLLFGAGSGDFGAGAFGVAAAGGDIAGGTSERSSASLLAASLAMFAF